MFHVFSPAVFRFCLLRSRVRNNVCALFITSNVYALMCLCCSQIDFGTKLWCCPFCFTRNHFPPHYAENITETNLPAELIPQFTTLEYQLPGKLAGPPAFLFVVDACVPDNELDALKDSLQQVCVCVCLCACTANMVCFLHMPANKSARSKDWRSRKCVGHARGKPGL